MQTRSLRNRTVTCISDTAKAICLDFGLAAEFGGKCNLRFDDTNPSKEETEYVHAIMEDVKWLGVQWDDLYYASDYFQQLYDWAIQLIKAGKACDLTADEIREYSGTLTEPGTGTVVHSPTVPLKRIWICLSG